MGEVAAKLWSQYQGQPAPKEGLRILQGWSRERLISAVAGFRQKAPSFAVNSETFAQCMDFENNSQAARVFKTLAKGSKLDFLSVIGPMIMMSDQQHISRANFLFSLYDFNGNGSINRAEFWIAMRTLFVGFSRMFQHAVVPEQDEIEQITEDVFNRVDSDGSGQLLLGEALSFAYRSKALRQIMEPFPVNDPRIFEEIIAFDQPGLVGNSQNNSSMAVTEIQGSESATKQKLRLSPDPCGSSKRPGSRASLRGNTLSSQPQRSGRRQSTHTGATKSHAWVAWKAFEYFSDERAIPFEKLKEIFSDSTKTKRAFDDAVNNRAGSQIDRPGDGDIQKILLKISARSSQEALVDMGSQPVSLRALFCIIWPAIPERDIEACYDWCRQFQAHIALQELLDENNQNKANIDREDLQAVIEIADMDGDGEVSVEELCSKNFVTRAQAQKLMRFDSDGSGKLKLGELYAAVYKMEGDVQDTFKGAFARSETLHH